MIEWHIFDKEEPSKEGKLLILINGEMFFGESKTRYFSAELDLRDIIKFYIHPQSKWLLPVHYAKPSHWAYLNNPEDS